MQYKGCRKESGILQEYKPLSNRDSRGSGRQVEGNRPFKLCKMSRDGGAGVDTGVPISLYLKDEECEGRSPPVCNEVLRV